jgi:hypothetical protein
MKPLFVPELGEFAFFFQFVSHLRETLCHFRTILSPHAQSCSRCKSVILSVLLWRIRWARYTNAQKVRRRRLECDTVTSPPNDQHNQHASQRNYWYKKTRDNTCFKGGKRMRYCFDFPVVLALAFVFMVAHKAPHTFCALTSVL